MPVPVLAIHQKRFPRGSSLLIVFLISALILGGHAQTLCNRHHDELTFENINDTSFSLPPNEHVLANGFCTNNSNPITLVSIYYPAAEKDLAYLTGYMKIYLARVATPIVFFTSETFKPMIQELRGDLPIHFVTRYSDPADFGYISRLKTDSIFEEQVKVLYVRPGKNAVTSKIWNAKPAITAMAATINPFQSDIFVYLDAGGLFPSVLPQNGGPILWPDYEKIHRAVNCFNTEQVFISRIVKTWGDPLIPWYQGTWYAGNARSVIQYANQYYEALRNISARSLYDSSILSDETTMLDVVQNYPEHFSVLTNRLPVDGPNCAGTWRVFGHTLKGAADQKENTDCVGRGYDETNFIPAAAVFASMTTEPRSGSYSFILISASGCVGVLSLVVYLLLYKNT